MVLSSAVASAAIDLGVGLLLMAGEIGEGAEAGGDLLGGLEGAAAPALWRDGEAGGGGNEQEGAADDTAEALQQAAQGGFLLAGALFVQARDVAGDAEGAVQLPAQGRAIERK